MATKTHTGNRSRLAAAVSAVATLGVALAYLAGSAVSAQAATVSGTGRAHAAPAFCQHGGARLWSHLAECGWPGPGNTGPQLSQCPHHRLFSTGTNLEAHIAITKPHSVISCENITGMLYVEAQDVTIKNVSIISNSGRTGEAANGTADIFIADGASATIDHVTINGEDGVHACVWDQGTTESVNAVNCYGVDDGIWSWADTHYSPKTGDHFRITNSYFHNFTHRTSNGHEDGYQTEGASDGLIQHNTYLLTEHADSDVAIWDGLKSSSNITVADNLMTGGGFAVYAEDYNPGEGGSPAVGGYSVSNIHFIGNDFSTYASGCVGEYGVWFTRPAWLPYQGGPTDGWHRSGNKVLETGQNVDAGNPYNNGARCQ
jgi:hypothetical protein